MNSRFEPRHLPGEELVEKGIRDLESRVLSRESLLVSIGAPRLRRLGFELPAPLDDPEERLYLLLRDEVGAGRVADLVGTDEFRARPAS